MNQAIAIIPARAGSKGIPGKNKKPLAGVPLISWAIRVAKRASQVSEIYVTTDSKEIAEIAEAEGAQTIMRPPELATDSVPTLPVVRHVFERIKKKHSPFVLLEPTSPFRSPEIVNLCLEKLFSGNCRSVVTVTQLERNPYNILQVEGDFASRFIKEPSGTFLQRQAMSSLKRVNGCVYAGFSESLDQGSFVEFPLKFVEMSPEESVNIDSPLDWQLAEILAVKYLSRIQ